MSSSTLQAVWPGDRYENIREFPNSWGTAPIVWSEFCVRYFHRESSWWLIYAGTESAAFWELWKDLRIPASHRAVFLWTLDNIYVKRSDYRRFAKDLRAFLEATKISANHVNHWPLIAQAFEMEPDYPALALWCTSVTSDPWQGPYDEEADSYGPFDWTKASDLYAELDGVGQ